MLIRTRLNLIATTIGHIKWHINISSLRTVHVYTVSADRSLHNWWFPFRVASCCFQSLFRRVHANGDTLLYALHSCVSFPSVMTVYWVCPSYRQMAPQTTCCTQFSMAKLHLKCRTTNIPPTHMGKAKEQYHVPTGLHGGWNKWTGWG